MGIMPGTRCLKADVSDRKRSLTAVEEALASSQCVISVMGEHAGEGTNFIFNRKISDLEQIGQTFWLIRSPKARPAHVQKMCLAAQGYTIFRHSHSPQVHTRLFDHLRCPKRIKISPTTDEISLS
jgi:hypothetical protein